MDVTTIENDEEKAEDKNRNPSDIRRRIEDLLELKHSYAENDFMDDYDLALE